MTDLFPDPGTDWKLKLKRLLLDFDARIDSAIFEGGTRLLRKPVQPRGRRATPARILVQALRVCDRAGERIQA